MDHSRATYEDFKARIPCQLNGKDQVANYAIRTESSNRDPTYIKKAETICRTYGWLALEDVFHRGGVYWPDCC
ncbi:hypothetical protein Tco_0699482, partial [Tanacetum coccineum]